MHESFANALWLLCLRLWLLTQYPLFTRMAARLAPRVTYFPDGLQTRIVRHLTTCGLTNEQIGAIWDSNGTWEKID
jgi:hypothetical protein